MNKRQLAREHQEKRKGRNAVSVSPGKGRDRAMEQKHYYAGCQEAWVRVLLAAA